MNRTAKVKTTIEQVEPEVTEEKVDPPIELQGLPKRELLRIDEVANYFDVTETTIRVWIAHGHLQVEKLAGSIRILRSSVANFRLRSRIMG